jgi:hypothetical protein
VSHLRTLSMTSPTLRLAAQGLGIVLLTLVVIYVMSGRELPLLLAGLAGLFCLWLFKNPHWGVLAIFTFWIIKFSPALFGSRYLALPYIIAALLCVPLALSLLRDREVWVWRVPQVKYLLAIGALFLVSTVWADYKYPISYFPQFDRTADAMREFVTHFLFLVFFLYFVNTRRRLELAVWLAVTLVVASVASAYVNLLSVSNWQRANASFGVGTNPTSFPYVSLFGASLLWCYYSTAQTTRWKGWIVPFLVGLPVMAIASGSRTGLLQFLVFGALLVVDRSGSWSSSKRIRGVLLLACVLILVSVLVPTVAVLRSTSFTTSVGGAGGHSLNERVNIVYSGVAIAASDPLLGVGIGNFVWLNTSLYGLKKAPHNSYLWALAEGGIGVLILYLLLFRATYRMLTRLEAAGPPDLLWLAKGLKFNLILLLVFSLTDDTWLTTLFYFLLGATIALYRMWQMQLQSSGQDHSRLLDPRRVAEFAR